MDSDEEMDECRLFGDLMKETEVPQADGEFARPIEDEDLFGGQAIEENEDKGLDEPDELFPEFLEDDKELPSNILEADRPNSISNEVLQVLKIGETTDAENENGTRDTSNEQVSELDDIFLDDYESDSEVNKLTRLNENPARSYANPAKLPSPAQIKKNLFKERLLQQAKAQNLVPKLGRCFNHNDQLEILVDSDKLSSNQSSKFFFNKLFNASSKSNKSPEKMSWCELRNKVKREICSQKRKVWDSFQMPAVIVDEDEEIIEPSEQVESKQNAFDLDNEEIEEIEEDVRKNPANEPDDMDIEEESEEEVEEVDSPLSSTDPPIQADGARKSLLLISDDSSSDSVNPVRRNILEDDEEDELGLYQGDGTGNRTEVDV